MPSSIERFLSRYNVVVLTEAFSSTVIKCRWPIKFLPNGLLDMRIDSERNYGTSSSESQECLRWGTCSFE